MKKLQFHLFIIIIFINNIACSTVIYTAQHVRKTNTNTEKLTAIK